ncbi:hypothetical protein MKX01_028571 [Papaver californicum]|nr:hypothetical protein MKX01_028571 [Papaver californicum]
MYQFGILQLVVLPYEYTVDDVKNKAMSLVGFIHGPVFELYGLEQVSATGSKHRFIITGGESLKCYIANVHGKASFFTVPCAEEVKLVPPPITPIARTSLSEATSPLTPHGDAKVSSSENDSSKNEPFKGEGTDEVPTRVPNVRRCLVHPDATPPAKDFPRLPDALSTPEPAPGSSPHPELEKIKYDDLVIGNFFKTKAQLQLILKIAAIEGSFKYTCETSNNLVLHVKCKDSTCK